MGLLSATVAALVGVLTLLTLELTPPLALLRATLIDIRPAAIIVSTSAALFLTPF